jgi:hypothetical protein
MLGLEVCVTIPRRMTIFDLGWLNLQMLNPQIIEDLCNSGKARVRVRA